MVRYITKQFIEIIKEAEVLEEFNINIFYKVIEKMTVFEGQKIIVGLLDVTELEL